MPALTPEKIRKAQAFVETGVFSARENAKGNTKIQWETIARKVSQGTGKGFYSGASNIRPIGKKGPGGYQFENVSSFVYELNSERFGSGLEMDVDDVKDDKFSIYQEPINELGLRMEQFPHFGCFELLIEGDQTVSTEGRDITCVDGLAFFSASHLVSMRAGSGGTTYSNRLTSLALNTTNFKTAYKELENRTDTQGKKMGLQPNTLWVPPSLRFAAADVLLAANAASGATNVYSNEMLKAMGEAPIVIHVVQELEADPTFWYLGCNNGSRRPMVWQETEPLALIDNNDPRSENMFKDDKMVWLVKGRSQFGWGDPRTIVRCEA